MRLRRSDRIRVRLGTLLAGIGVLFLCGAAFGQKTLGQGRAVSDSAARTQGKKETFEGIIYRSPDGWKADAARKNMRLFTAPETADGKQVTLLLGFGPEISGDFRAAFDRVMKVGTQDNTIVKASEVASTRSTEGYDVLAQTMLMEDRAGQRACTLHVAINANGRFVLVSLFATSEALFARYQPAFRRFLTDLELPTAKAAAPSPAGNEAARDDGPVRRESPAEVAKDEAARRRPGVVQGEVYDTKGRRFRFPGVKARVHIWGFSAAGERVFFDTQVDENGHYEKRVPHGLYVVQCSAKFPLGDHVVAVALDMLDEGPTEETEDSTPGIVKDFGLKLSGPVLGGKPDSFAGYHGGGLYVTDGANWKEAVFGSLERRYPQGTFVEVTLTPRSRLIDGSSGKTMTLKCELGRMQTGHTHANIPLALYTATAQLVTPNGNRHPCKVALLPNLAYADSVEIVFNPNKDDMNGGPETPNLFVLD